jgi:lipopolysaccharide biosynthesis regulator YciM
MPIFRRSPAARIKHAASLRRAGDFPAAIDVLADVLTEDPDDTTANAEMARALRLIGDSAGAEEHLRIALKDVLDYQLVVELAGVVAEQNRIKEAQDLIDAALAMANGNPRLDPGEALLVRAVIEAGRGKKKLALAALDQIVPKRAGPQVKEYAARLREVLEPSSASEA